MDDAIRSLKALLVTGQRRPSAGRLGGHLRNVAGGIVPIAKTAVGKVMPGSVEATVLAVRVQAEQAANPASRVTLGRDRDRFGVPRPVLDWQVSGEDVRSIRRSEDLLDGELRAAGLASIERKLGEEDPPVVFEGLHHHMGTTRMDVDPKRGVVDGDGRVHGIRNLYVAGTSVFPTGGYINPTFTVVALAIRLADHVKSTIATT
jgi:choline dehydrogenase-like flavoprotein